MQQIPITFHIEGKNYNGKLSELSGNTGNVWQLTVNNYYCGQLVYTKAGFTFYANDRSKEFESLARDMEDVLISWYGS